MDEDPICAALLHDTVEGLLEEVGQTHGVVTGHVDEQGRRRPIRFGAENQPHAAATPNGSPLSKLRAISEYDRRAEYSSRRTA